MVNGDIVFIIRGTGSDAECGFKCFNQGFLLAVSVIGIIAMLSLS